MDKKKNNTSLMYGVPGICLQFGGFCLSGFLVGTSPSPALAATVTLGAVLLGTALLMVGLAYYAMAKGHSPVWCLMGFLGIIGLIVLAALPDRHIHGQRVGQLSERVADTPSEHSTPFNCPECDYQLNGISGNTCPECGRPFDPYDLTTVKVGGYYTEKTAPWMGRWSLICGIIGIVLVPTLFCGPIAGIIGISFGYSARKDIRTQDLPGAGVAKAGLITSYVAIGLSLAVVFLAFILPLIADALAPPGTRR